MAATDLARAHLRVARPTDDLDALVRFYRDGLGFSMLGGFAGHDGFDGVMLGHAGATYHLEFTRKAGHAAGRAPTQDNLLVFYLPDRSAWQAAVDRLLGLGHHPIPSFNPYWDQNGATFEDPDGYRVVLQNAAWPAAQQVADAQREDLRGTGELIAAYEAGTTLLRASVDGMSAEQLRSRPVPGKWSVLEVICHVSDCEQFFADRMKRTLAMDRPLLVGADGWRYPEAGRYHDRQLEEELALVELTRRQMARILTLVPDEAWQRPAVHTETGEVTLRQLLLHAVRHLEHHVAFLEEKWAALGVPPPKRGHDRPEVSSTGNSHTSTNPVVRIATTPNDLGLVRVLFQEYARSLGFDLCFQGFAEELAGLPGRYAPPSGCLLLATVGGKTAGCVALKELADGICEMKRLYIRPQQRGTGLGRILANRILAEARRIGYQAIRLDTVPSVMAGAVALYRSLGFREIPPYCHNPVPGAMYMELALALE